MDFFFSDITESFHKVPHPFGRELEDLQGFPSQKMDCLSILEMEHLIGTIGNPGIRRKLEPCETTEEGSLRPARGDAHLPPPGQGLRHRLGGGHLEVSGKFLLRGQVIHPPGKPHDGSLGGNQSGKGEPDGIRGNAGGFQVFCKEDRTPGKEENRKERRRESTESMMCFLANMGLFREKSKK